MPKRPRHDVANDFSVWKYQLRNGFSILLYGAGSKKGVLDSLSEELDDGAVISVQGFLSNIQPGQLLVPLAASLKEGRECRVDVTARSQGQRLSQREKRRLLDEISSSSHPDSGAGGVVYLIIHSIDSPQLRTPEWRKVLQKIAACDRIRVIASADSILCPLLFSTESWNQKFNFWPHHVTTNTPFSPEERALVPQLQSSKTWVASSSQSAEVVLRSLTKNGRDVFREVCECQLDQIRESEKAKEEERENRPAVMYEKASTPALELGLTVTELYRRCRLKFLVTNETALHAHLREYKDHGLLRGKRKADGAEALFVPLPEECIEGLLKKLKSFEDL